MGLFDKWFRKKGEEVPSESTGLEERNPIDEDEDIPPAAPEPIDGPPEFVRLAEMQRAYWTYNAGEQAELEGRGFDQLSWPERLRLHHLICMQRLHKAPDFEDATKNSQQIVQRLMAPDSPYRSRYALISQSEPGPDREPDLQGPFMNKSLTHLGCFEIYRLDENHEPTQIDFVTFDDVAGAMFAPAKIIRAGRLHYENGSSELVFFPLLYGLTWAIGNEYDRDGRMTRFVRHLESDHAIAKGVSGIGVGHQDFSISNQDGGETLFGLGSVTRITFPLDMCDPRFDEKARGRGADPDELRRQMNEQ